MKRAYIVILSVFVITLSSLASSPGSRPQKDSIGSTPDKVYMQKIWDGSLTLDPTMFRSSTPAARTLLRCSPERQLRRIRERREEAS